MTIILLLIIILLLLYVRKNEHFNNVYMKYRDLIDQRQIFPSKISDNCFVDKYRRCNGANLCQRQQCALEQCKGPPMISETYPF
jgi:hypothetical protein